MESFLRPDWSRHGKSLGDLRMWPWNVPPLKMAMRANQLAEHELQMEMAAGQDQQNGGRCNTNHRGWYSKTLLRKASSLNTKRGNFFKFSTTGARRSFLFLRLAWTHMNHCESVHPSPLP